MPTGGRPIVARHVRGAVALAVVLTLAGAAPARAQAPPAERLTFREAVERAMARNPSAAIAAAGILRAEALLSQARADAGLQINSSVTSTTLNRGVQFEGATVTPRTSVTASGDIRYPLYAPATWARRAEARAGVDVATLDAAETRRQTALAAADAYLAIIARRRVVEANVRARDAAKAHADLAQELENRGTGSRLNRLRAQQELSTDEGLIEQARFALYAAQEALGVLLAAGGPVDAAEEPTFDAPPADAVSVLARTDLRLFTAQEQLAERVLRNNGASYLPVFQGIFQPQTMYPAQFFSPQNSWRAILQLDVPLFDSGRRAAEKRVRQVSLDVARATLTGATTTASSEVRTARAAVASAERQLTSVRAAADQAQQVVEIVNVSFRAGAATNIEVIDAERRARDADTSVAVAEDTLRRARFDLLNALGQFP